MIILIILLTAFITAPKIQAYFSKQEPIQFTDFKKSSNISPQNNNTENYTTHTEKPDSISTNSIGSNLSDTNASEENIETGEENNQNFKHIQKNNYSSPNKYKKPSQKREESQPPVVLQNFDPNKLTVEKAQSLGMSKRVAATLVKYTGKGGKFYKKEDLKKVYGMTDELYSSLEPYIQIEKIKATFSPKKEEPKREIVLKNFNPNELTKETAMDLGLSSRVASNIEKYLSKGGKFYKKEDIKKIYNFEESDFERLKKYIKIPKQKYNY